MVGTNSKVSTNPVIFSRILARWIVTKDSKVRSELVFKEPNRTDLDNLTLLFFFQKEL